jgi:hypothetical protein
MIEQELPLRIEVGGFLEARSHCLHVLAHAGIDHLIVAQYRDALHQFVALGIRLTDIVVIPEAPPSVEVSVEVSNGIEIENTLLLRAELSDAPFDPLELRLEFGPPSGEPPFETTCMPQSRKEGDRIFHPLGGRRDRQSARRHRTAGRPGSG